MKQLTDIYYNPEHYGLQVVGEISWDDEPYQFDLTAVWTDGDKYYWASDSGCSCPSPFESFHRGNIESGTKYDLHNYLMQRATDYDEYRYQRLMNQIVELMTKVFE